jgi:dTDP-4-dehydrorhamnose reductase
LVSAPVNRVGRSDCGPRSTKAGRYATPIFAGDFADLLWQAIAQDLHGTYHLAGAERVNMWQFAAALAAVAGTTVKVLQTIAAGETDGPSIGSIWQHMEETSLDSRHLQRTIKTSMPLLRDGLSRFLTQASDGRRQLLEAAIGSATWESSAA